MQRGKGVAVDLHDGGPSCVKGPRAAPRSQLSGLPCQWPEVARVMALGLMRAVGVRIETRRRQTGGRVRQCTFGVPRGF